MATLISCELRVQAKVCMCANPVVTVVLPFVKSVLTFEYLLISILATSICSSVSLLKTVSQYAHIHTCTTRVRGTRTVPDWSA